MIGYKVLPGRLPPRAVLPLKDEYVTVGDVLGKYYVYSMTRGEFVGLCMKWCHGMGNPKRFSEVYDDLMEEAGLPPLEDEIGDKK